MNKRLLCLVLLWVVSFFAVLGWWPEHAYNAQRYFEWLLLGCLLVVGAALPVGLVLDGRFAITFLLLGLLALLVVVMGNHFWLGLRYLLEYVALVGVVLAIAKARVRAGGEKFDQAALLGVVLFCFGTSLIVMEGLVLAMVGGSLTQESVFGAFANVRMFSDVQFATLLLLPAASLLAATTRMRLLVGVTAALWWGWLFFSGTRTALLVLPVAMLMVWVAGGRRSLLWFKHMLVQAGAGLLVFVLLRLVVWQTGFLLGGSLSYLRAGGSGRLALWQDAWLHFLQHPWLGEGAGAFSCFTVEAAAKPHNLLLLLLSEWGGLVVLLLALLVVWSLFSIMRNLRVSYENTPLKLSLFASLLAILGASQFEGVTIAPLGQMTTVLVLGWGLGVFAAGRLMLLDAEEQRVTRGWRLLRWPWLAFVLPMWLVMTQADLVLQQNLLVVPKQALNWTYWPRYWLEGHDYCPDWRQRYEKKMFAPPTEIKN